MTNVQELSKTKATTRQLINLSKVLYQKTGYMLIMFPSESNPKQNYIAGLVPPGKRVADKIDLGDIPNVKIREHVLKLLEITPYKRQILPKSISLDRIKFARIMMICDTELVGKLINLLYKEIFSAYRSGQPYANIDGKTANIIRTYAQVYDRYNKFKNKQVETNVRNTLLSNHAIVCAAVIKAMDDGDEVFPKHYGVELEY